MMQLYPSYTMQSPTTNKRINNKLRSKAIHIFKWQPSFFFEVLLRVLKQEFRRGEPK